MKNELKIETITVGAFAMNSFLLMDPQSNEAIFIDPGGEADKLIKAVESKNLNLKCIINTHCHIDHVAELSIVKKHFDVPFYIHRGDLSLLDNLKEQGGYFGIHIEGIPEVTSFLEDGDHIQFGKFKGTILHTPGHSPGSISILIGDHVFVGDVLFLDSIGRTDLPGGDYDQLISTIRTKLFTLNDGTTVYPGHGPNTSIARERQYNPFFNA